MAYTIIDGNLKASPHDASADTSGGTMRAIALPRGSVFPAKSAKRYVRDGLVSMWDGIENAGWGLHDASAATWKDLIGSADQAVTGGTGWLDNGYSWDADTTVRRLFGGGTLFETHQFTLDVLVSRSSQYGANYPGIGGYDATAALAFRPNDATSRAGFWAYGTRRVAIAYSAAVKSAVITCDGETIRFYLNGTSVGSVALDTSYSMANGLYWRRGIIYATRLYSRALTASEIAYNYSIDHIRFGV